MMRRREFIAGLGSVAAWPAVARAQQPAMPVIGHLTDWTVEADAVPLAAFRQGLRVRPGTSSRIAYLSQHEADGSEFEESESAAIEILPILGQSAATV